MKVLLTGAAGFVGSHVLDRLLADGHEVLGIDSLEPRVHPAGVKPRWWPNNVELLVQPVSNIAYWARAEAEVVIHLAAQVGVADSMTDPMRYVQGNTEQTALMLNDLRQCLGRKNLRRVVVASSMSIYGEGGMLVPETHPVVPASVYGLTKYDQERLVLMWGEQHRVEAVALRLFNVYGPRQALTNPYTGVLANFAQAILADKPPIVYEDGGQTRDFVYVADVADAIVRAATMPDTITGAFNVCTGWPTTIIDAALMLRSALHKPALPITITRTQRPGDIRDCTGLPDKFNRASGWYAKRTFADGIEAYAGWLLG